MFFKTINRYNPKTGNRENYYSLVESYRNALGVPSHRTILSLGYQIDGSLPFREISDKLNDLISVKQHLFPLEEKSEKFMWYLYHRLVKENKIDVLKKIHQDSKEWETVKLSTLTNENVRESGCEWMCLQTLKELDFENFLSAHGWDENDIQLAISHIISRAVYPASELKTVGFMRENSSVCELTGYPVNLLTKDKLYGITKRLYNEKDKLEVHLSKKTNSLFDLEDTIIIYDLTNTYFEGSKRDSQIARYGRSKEKRNDCPLIVLALVVNVEGFIKYSAILRGNISDCTTLLEMVENLRTVTSTTEDRPIVVIDAGIATAANLESLKNKGYDYVCVSRSNLKKYEVVDAEPVLIKDNRERDIELREVTVKDGGSEYYLKVTSPQKSLKDSAMSNLFVKRFEEEITKISESIHKKGGVKKYGKVCERIGRLKSKYSSANKLFSIEIEKDDSDNCTSLKWNLIPEAVIENKGEHGVYFLKTSLKKEAKLSGHQALVWAIYNCIRNVESTIRVLKHDLDLRPVYHKTDDATMAHLHLGLLAYWLVNTIRHKLKKNGIHYSWREIVRVMNTQKIVTTRVENDKKQVISIRKYSEPSAKVKLIYDALGYNYAPFTQKKSVVNKSEFSKNLPVDFPKVNSR